VKPAPFDNEAPRALDEVLALLARYGSEGKILAVEVARRHGDFALVGVAAVIALDESGLCRQARLVCLGAGDVQHRAIGAARLPGTRRDRRRLLPRAAGRGGWGDPLEREPWRIARDVRNGCVSLATARADYGVVIEPGTWSVDAAATARLRAELRASPSPPLGEAGFSLTSAERGQP